MTVAIYTWNWKRKLKLVMSEYSVLNSYTQTWDYYPGIDSNLFTNPPYPDNANYFWKQNSQCLKQFVWQGTSACEFAVLWEEKACLQIVMLQPRTNSSVMTIVEKARETIQGGVLACNQKLTWVSLIYRTEPTTKKWKNQKVKKTEKLSSIGKQSWESVAWILAS